MTLSYRPQSFLRPSMVLLTVVLTMAAWLIPTGASSLPMPQVDASALAFVPNAGQSDPQVRYQAHGFGGTLFFTPEEVVLSLPAANAGPSAAEHPSDTPAAQSSILRLRFEGANPDTAIVAGDRLQGVYNYLLGNDPRNWQTGLPTYASLNYRELYPGITMHYAGTDGSLKSTYFVDPGVDPSAIRWRYDGAQSVAIDPATGDLQITLPVATGDQSKITERAPVAWQEIGGRNVPVAVRYELATGGRVGFVLGSYDPAHPLVIDPTLQYSTYLGGSGTDRFNAVAVDSTTGDVFAAGETYTAAFPGASVIGTNDTGTFPNILVVRMAAGGGSTVYRTIVGGTNTERGLGIAVSSSVAAVAGYTSSADLPTSAFAYDTIFNGGEDMFALTLTPSGALEYGTFLGGGGVDRAYGIGVQGDNLFVAGQTEGASFGIPQGGNDVLVLKLDKTVAGAGGLLYSTRMGGINNDAAYAIAVDPSGNAFLTGQTASITSIIPGQGFPISGLPYQGISTNDDAFIVKLDGGGGVLFSSYFGGSGGIDTGLGIAVDPVNSDNVYLTGRTLSSDLPETPGSPAGQDAFVTKINIGTRDNMYSHYLGSAGVDEGAAIAVDAAGAAYITGYTNNPASFTVFNPLAGVTGGNFDAFVARYAPDGTLSYSTLLGGASNDWGTGVATLNAAAGTQIYVAGYTSSTNFPMTNPPTPIQSTNGGGEDGFIAGIINVRPALDLNDNNPGNGIDFGPVTWTEAGGAVVGSGPVSPVNPGGLTVIDTDNPDLAYAEVRFVDPLAGADGVAIVPPDAAAESLSVTLSGGIAGSYVPATGILRLTGAAPLAEYQSVLRTLKYDNSSQLPTAGTRRLAVEINDGIDSNSPVAITTVTVVPTNDPPVLTVPGSVAAIDEETTGNVGPVSVTDLDAGTNPIQVTVSVPAGAGTLNATAAGGASVAGNDTNTLTVTGPQLDVSATLLTINFTGALDFNGSVTVTVNADDQGQSPAPAQTDSETYTFTVNPLNDAPVVPGPAPTITTLEDTPKTVSIVTDLGVTDAKDTTSPPAAPGAAPFVPVTSLTTFAGPTNGSLTYDKTLGTITYTPNPNFNGADSFTYTVCDLGTPGSQCSNQVVNVTVTAVNDAPGFTKGPDVTVLEDSGAYSGAAWATGISAGPADEAGQILTFEVTANTNPALFSAGPAIASNGTLTFTPAPNANGSATVSVRLKDSGGTDNGGVDASAPQSFTITVTPVNDAPGFTKGPDVVILEDSGPFTFAWATSISAGPADEATQTLTFEVSNDNNSLFSVQPAIAADGTLTFTSAPDANGNALVTVRLKDDGGTLNGGADTSSPDQTFTITVTPVNDKPTFTGSGNVTVDEDSGAYGPAAWVTATDFGPPDEDATQAVGSYIVTNSNSTLFSSQPAIDTNGQLSFTPAANASGSVTVTVQLQDNGGTASGGVDTSDPQTFRITIRPVNDLPVARDDTAATNEDTPVLINVLANDDDKADTDFGGAPLAPPANITVTGAPAHGTTAIVTGTVQYTPPADYNGSDSLTYQVCDNGTPLPSECASATVDITVNPANDPPSFTMAPNVTVAEDSAAFGQDNWTTVTSFGPADEADQAVLGYQVTNDSNALFSVQPAIDPAGRLTFTPAPNANGAAIVTVKLQDNGGTANGGVDTSASRTFTITITEVNDPPVAANDTFRVGKNSIRNVLDVLANDNIGPDTGQTLTPTAITVLPTHGTASFEAGKLIYVPTPGYLGPDTLTYQVCDNGTTAGAPDPLCTTATVQFEVVVFQTYMPWIFEPAYADLVGSFTVSDPSVLSGDAVTITVTITNRGDAPASKFWVDFYINPSEPPTAANQRWEKRCGLVPCYGIAWFVEQTVEPGQSITLVSTSNSYFAKNTIWKGSFAKGTKDLYLYVDSFNCTTDGSVCVPYGAVEESDETNNRASYSFQQPLRPFSEQPAPDLLQVLPVDLPPRPARPD